MNPETKLHEKDGVPKALVVEDYYVLRDILSEMLYALGFDVWAVESSEDALPLANRLQPDVIVVDYHLGDGAMTGAELVSYLRMHIVLKDTPIVAISGFKGRSREAFETAGVDCFVEKPFRLVNLQGALAKALGGVG